MGPPYLWSLKFCHRIVDPSLVQLKGFRSASIEVGNPTLWVIRDRVEPVAGPAMSAFHPIATKSRTFRHFGFGP